MLSAAATAEATKAPVHPLAIAGFAIAVLAFALALYGSQGGEKQIAGTPLATASNAPGLASTQNSKITRYSLQIVAFVLPFALGIGAALTGGSAMNAVEKSEGKHRGNLLSVFAILLGSLSAVIGGCMILSVYLWKYLPSFYTT